MLIMDVLVADTVLALFYIGDHQEGSVLSSKYQSSVGVNRRL